MYLQYTCLTGAGVTNRLQLVMKGNHTPKEKKRKSKKLIYRDSGVAKSLKIFKIKQKKNQGYKKNIQK